MSIRNWSLTRYWAITFGSWLAAFTLLTGFESLRDYGSVALVPLLVLTFAPAFWAGIWAGSHPEIRFWPPGRIVVMWVLGAGLILLVGGPLEEVGGFAVAAIIAPLTILTWAWRESRTTARLLE